MISEVKIWINKEWKKYIPVIIFFLFIVKSTNRMFGGNGDCVPFVAYLYVMFEGTKPPDIQNIKIVMVDIPYLYMLFNLYITYIVAYYPFKNKQNTDIQFVLKYQNRYSWWIRKCVWNIFVVLSFYSVGLIMFAVAHLLNRNISCNADMPRKYGCYNELSCEKIIVIGFVAMIISVGIHIFQMMLSVVVNKVTSLVIIISIYIISIYKCRSLLVGNYLMMYRYISWSGSEALNEYTGLLIGTILFVVGVVTGGILIKKVEFI